MATAGQPHDKRRIAVIGGGAWGSAIASALAKSGHVTKVLTRRDDLAEALMDGRSPALNDLPITPPMLASTDSEAVVSDAEAVMMVVPVRATESSLADLKPYLGADVPIAFAAKGFIPGADDLIPSIARGIIASPLVMFSGPSFADEVAKGLPAALVSASDDANAAKMIAAMFAPTSMRVYSSDDVIGVAVGGAVKNVIAIASGITAGLGLGDNARAALLTRGLAEATRLAVAMGGRSETLFGLAGLGDMALTCSGPHSRNFAFGLALGQGKTPPGQLAEGQYSSAVIARRAAALGVDMPITMAVDRVVSGKAELAAEIKLLLARPAAMEW